MLYIYVIYDTTIYIWLSYFEKRKNELEKTRYGGVSASGKKPLSPPIIFGVSWRFEKKITTTNNHNSAFHSNYVYKHIRYTLFGGVRFSQGQTAKRAHNIYAIRVNDGKTPIFRKRLRALSVRYWPEMVKLYTLFSISRAGLLNVFVSNNTYTLLRDLCI